ncbi:MAG: hypothetical protein JNL88_11195 [Bacteroidia bacterium]|nr:hypothetical protein [Bacteroidia bacterium]
MNEPSSPLVKLLLSKGGLVKDVTDQTYAVLQQLKLVLQQVESDLRREVHKVDSRIKIQYKDRGTFEAEIKVADDLLIFIMHTNAFVFDPSHPVWKNSYVSLDHTRATVGMISIYNFLSDSFKFDRKNDVGHLVARMFVNREGNFFVEGKRQLGILFNDYTNSRVSAESIRSLVENCLSFSLDIDASVPPFDAMKEITVFEAMVNTMQSTISTSKRLGFKFEGDSGPEA